jgi:hypothetical protein
MISKKDRDALRRCLQQIEADPQWSRNFAKRKADGESWLDRAFFACGILQTRNLKLLPWQIAPCHSDPAEGDHRHSQFQARKLEAKQYADALRGANLSIFEADPQAALAAAGAREPLHVVEENFSPDAA